jgi:putative FmdB family regulatory protein
MPNYLYRCDTCEYDTERHHGFADGPPDCLRCMQPLRKIITVPGVKFKGGGWGSSKRTPASEIDVSDFQ